VTVTSSTNVSFTRSATVQHSAPMLTLNRRMVARDPRAVS
jgi:hypothetical protein